MSNKLKILVVGATGQQGGAVSRALLNKGHIVRGLTRSSSSKGALELAAKGVEIVQGDLTDNAALDAALDGVDGVFGVTTPFEAGVEEEAIQGINLVDAVQRAGVKHMVFSSVGKANTKTGIPHFDSKYAVEEHLEKSGVPHTIVAPVFFLENWLSPWFLPPLRDGNVALAMSPDRRLAQISVDDIGAFVALAFDKPEEFIGKRFDIASDDLSGEEIAEQLGAHLGRDFGFFQIPIEGIRAENEDFAVMFEWFEKTGYDVDLDALKRKYPEVGWTDFNHWISRQDWSVLEDSKKQTGT